MDDDAQAPQTSASAGCGREGRYEVGETISSHVEHDGARRTFRVHLPPTYDVRRPAPLVVMLHGGGGSGAYFENRSTRMNAVADREGFITVYPDATGGGATTWNAGECCGSAARRDVDDVGFVAALLDHLEAELCVDERRVYAAGMSNGAMLAYRLACELSDRFAAVAPVAGSDMTTACAPSRPVGVLHVHGSKDANVPWGGGKGCGVSGATFTSVDETLERWRARNGCAKATSTWRVEGDGRCVAYDGCAGGVATVLCTIDGGGHEWPGGEPLPGALKCDDDGALSTTFSASEAAWRFFRDHALP